MTKLSPEAFSLLRQIAEHKVSRTRLERLFYLNDDPRYSELFEQELIYMPIDYLVNAMVFNPNIPPFDFRLELTDAGRACLAAHADR